MTWVCLPREGFSTAGHGLRTRQSSASVKRAFCGDCGAQIYMDYQGSATIDVSVGTLDHPERVEVLDNIWTVSRLPLMKGFDGALPQHGEFAPRR